MNWLLEHNGRALGGLEVFPVFDARDPRKPWESIVRHFQQGWQDSFCGIALDFSSLLPFAQFGTGDYYCFDYAVLGDAGEPVVVLWSHETGRTCVVADGYTAFLANPDRLCQAPG
nr:hypothetical protein FFPRI1PSEUD_16990 [Pseudomonas sp. FFPRI_1]